jgi:hypothetical protein
VRGTRRSVVTAAATTHCHNTEDIANVATLDRIQVR